MKPTVSVFIATSLDGFIARENGDLDWLDTANSTVTEGEDCGYADFMASVDVLVMGRHTYEKVLSFGEWPYQDKPVIVLSSTSVELSPSMMNTVSCSNESPQALCSRLSQQGIKRIYIDGGITIQRFLSAGLVNDMVITLIPVVLGSGIPLFGKLHDDISLNHTATKTFDFGFVQLTYQVGKPA
ncbi:MAG: deaminase [Gammaproteobacteria bacterium]|nr:MAG: deaminase [Gammaproteobacteria bacterium]